MNDVDGKSTVACVGILHVIYYVSSMQESLEFYTEMLGLTTVDSLGDGERLLRTADTKPRLNSATQ